LIVASSAADQQLDLRGTPCPVNFIRCRLALEGMHSGQVLEVTLDRGEPEEMVVPGLERDGHALAILETTPEWLRIQVTCGEF